MSCSLFLPSPSVSSLVFASTLLLSLLYLSMILRSPLPPCCALNCNAISESFSLTIGPIFFLSVSTNIFIIILQIFLELLSPFPHTSPLSGLFCSYLNLVIHLLPLILFCCPIASPNGFVSSASDNRNRISATFSNTFPSLLFFPILHIITIH